MKTMKAEAKPATSKAPRQSDSLDTLKSALRAFISSTDELTKSVEKMPAGALRRSLTK